MGAGDVSKIIKALQGENIENAKEKLELIVKGTFMDVKVLMDKEKKDQPKSFKIASNKVFLLWLHLVKKTQSLTVGDLVDLFPKQEEQIGLWERFIDENGNKTDSVGYAAAVTDRYKAKIASGKGVARA